MTSLKPGVCRSDLHSLHSLLTIMVLFYRTTECLIKVVIQASDNPTRSVSYLWPVQHAVLKLTFFLNLSPPSRTTHRGQIYPVTVASKTSSRDELVNLNLDMKSSRLTVSIRNVQLFDLMHLPLTVTAGHASLATKDTSSVQHSPIVKDCPSLLVCLCLEL